MTARTRARQETPDADLAGRGGATTIKGTTGADTLTGGDAAETILGLGGGDVLSGGGGDDTLRGGLGGDQVDGGEGDDTITEDAAQGDTLIGGAGDDTITITNPAYYNQLKPGATLTIMGGDGNDVVKLATDNQDLDIDLGAGDDRISLYLRTYGITADRQLTLGAGRDTVVIDASSYIFELSHVLHVRDFATGRTGDLFDLGDYARVHGGDYSPDYNPFAWGDTWLEASGRDTLVVFRGVTVAVLDATQPRQFTDANFGFDLEAASPPGESFTGTAAGENHRGTARSDTITMLGGNDYVDADYGDDTIDGGNGDDYLIGSVGRDVLIGGAGNDTLVGGTGSDDPDRPGRMDQMSGGDGNDQLVASGSAELIEGGAGFDTLVFYNTRYNEVDVDLRRLLKDGTALLGGQTASGLEALDTRLSFVTNHDDTFLLGNLFADGLYLDGRGGDDRLMSGNGDSQITGGEGDDVLTTFAGADQLDGGDGDDLLSSGGGNDRLTTGIGVDRALGGGGDDTISTGVLTAGDWLDGGLGRDALLIGGSDQPVSLDFTSADGTVRFGGATARVRNFESIVIQLTSLDDTVVFAAGQKAALTLDGGDGNDRLTGGAASDRLTGGNGDDTLLGSGGVNTLSGGSGNDTYYVDSAADAVIDTSGTLDRIFASVSYTLAVGIETGTLTGDGATMLTGNALDNVLTGTSGANVLEGGAGSDTLDGQGGLDVASYAHATQAVSLRLGAGTTRVADGQGGKDTLISIEGLIGSAYNDLMHGNDAANVLRGGAGDDVLDGGYGDDVLDGGAGLDTVTYAAFAGAVRVDLSVDRAYFGTQTDEIYAIEKVVGSAYGDTIINNDYVGVFDGRAGDDRIDGGAANDSLTGGDGNDTLTAKAGDDVINGGAGNDVISGGDGKDSIVGGTGDNRIDGGAGIDSIRYDAWTTGVRVDLSVSRAYHDAGRTDEVYGIENVTCGIGDDTIINADTAATLFGGAGNDFIQGGLANDVMDGSVGIDTISFDRATAGVQASLELVYINNGYAMRATGGAGTDVFYNFENITGSAFDDTLRGSASGAFVLNGADGNDLLGFAYDSNSGTEVRTFVGGAGIDTLDCGSLHGGVTIDLGNVGSQSAGAAGSLKLSGIEAVAGTDADDTLTGDGADNTLGGGLGNDRLTGGGGADKFVFASVGDVDTITDFAHGVEKIVFPGSVAGLPVGTLPDGMFRNGSTALDGDDRILYDAGSGALYFDYDGVGGYDAFQVAVLSSRPTLSASDFVVI